MRRFLFVFCSLVLLGSCATLTKFEPKNDTDSLVIGKIELNNKNFAYYDSVSVNGTHYANIAITISDITTEQVFTAKTDEAGIFMFYNLGESHAYRIVKIYFKKIGETAWSDVAITIHNAPAVIYPENDKLIDIGYYIVQADGKTKISKMEKTGKPIKEEFYARYKDSTWLAKDYKFVE